MKIDVVYGLIKHKLMNANEILNVLYQISIFDLKEVQLRKVDYLRIVEYTSQRIPPVQYINTSVFSLSTFAKGSEAAS